MKRGVHSNKRKYRRGGGDNGVDTTITGNIDNIDMDNTTPSMPAAAMPAAAMPDASAMPDAAMPAASVTDAAMPDASAAPAAAMPDAMPDAMPAAAMPDASVSDASGNSGWFSGLKNLFGGRKRSSKKTKRVHFRLTRGGGKSVKKIKCKVRGKLKNPTKKRTCKRKPGRKCSNKN
jgi:hypothetical protein